MVMTSIPEQCHFDFPVVGLEPFEAGEEGEEEGQDGIEDGDDTRR